MLQLGGGVKSSQIIDAADQLFRPQMHDLSRFCLRRLPSIDIDTPTPASLLTIHRRLLYHNHSTARHQLVLTGNKHPAAA
jgi:hypothetical protein